jgi:hypothetical protein
MRLNSDLGSFTSGNHLQYPPNRRLSFSGEGDRCAHFVEEKNLLLLPGIEQSGT